jgi:hypothetical protein
MMKTLKIIILTFFLLLVIAPAKAQNNTGWDNQIYLGNKIAFGKERWKYSGEWQVRMENNFRNLDNWFLEFVSNYLISENFEIVPDLRFTIKPAKLELRPGLGVLYKYTGKNIQFVNQIKWQIDLVDKSRNGNAFREVVFLNYKFNDHIVGTLVTGFIYRWWPDWNGFQYIRVGPGISYIFDEKHILNFNYFVGVENDTKNWLWAGIPMIQLVINISHFDSYKYTPAYYFDF